MSKIIDHTHPKYVKKRNESGDEKYNGAFYYSKEIVKSIIPKVKTDRNWITVNIPSLEGNWDHSIVFIHNNKNPNYYKWLKKFKDLILVCGIPATVKNMHYYGMPIYLPLSVNVKQTRRHRRVIKTRDAAFAGRSVKMTNHLPPNIDILTGMCQTRLLSEMGKYKKIYAVGRTAIQAKILGCEIGVYDERFLDPKFWQIIDSSEAAEMLQKMIDKIDRK